MVEVKKYKYESIPGFTNETDFEFLQKVCEDAPDSGIIVELGSCFGRSAVFFAETMRKLGKQYEIYAVDIYWTGLIRRMYKEYLEYLQGDISLVYDLLDPNKILDKQLSMIELTKKFCSGFPEITIVKHDVFRQIPKPLHNKKISIVFEDSAHSYKSTMHCLENYFPRLGPNGIFCGDDYHWPEVSKAVKDYAKKNDLKIHTDNKIWRLE